MRLKRICVIALPVIALGAVTLWPRSAKVPPGRTPAADTSHALASADQIGPVEFIELHASVEQGLIKAEFRGNGRDKLRALLTNAGTAPLRVQADAGQTFESGTNAVVVVRSRMIEVPPGKTEELPLHTCATRSANKFVEMPYKLSYTKVQKLQPLLTYAAEHLELSPGALQTAALAVTENLPLSAVAKFPAADPELKSRFNTDAFRVETIDLIAGLAALRAIGIPDEAVAMTIDPQLKIEAMIEPLSRAAAMQYYDISPENEWEFWKSELLFGEPATRHYALYGIARFYPDIALDMLPKWAREPKTKNVYRISAMQALADTQRPDALPILRELADEFGSETELGRAARGAAEFLDQRLNQLALKQSAVAFRASKTISQF